MRQRVATADLWGAVGGLRWRASSRNLEANLIQRRARQRAGDLGVSLAEYVRRLVARDLSSDRAKADPVLVFDLGSSGGSGIAKDKDAIIAEAFAPKHAKSRRR